MPEKGETIREVLIEEDMKDAYINFAMSVIINRALPDVRDGLKPSQRRILVAMNDLNLGPTAKFRKSAKIAGDTAGNYHPHPESIYNTMVRMAQPFASRYVLIDGQGNFGSIDGDGPAAVRYTEARLSYPGQEMLADINMETDGGFRQELRPESRRACRSSFAFSEFAGERVDGHRGGDGDEYPAA